MGKISKRGGKKRTEGGYERSWNILILMSSVYFSRDISDVSMIKHFLDFLNVRFMAEMLD